MIFEIVMSILLIIVCLLLFYILSAFFIINKKCQIYEMQIEALLKVISTDSDVDKVLALTALKEKLLKFRNEYKAKSLRLNK